MGNVSRCTQAVNHNILRKGGRYPVVNTRELERQIRIKGVKKQTIAAKCGLTPQTFSGRIKGKTNFSCEEAKAVADALGLSPKERTAIFLN